MGRIMAIDPGLRRIGLAITDPLRILASPVGVVRVDPNQDPIPALLAEIERLDPELVLVGNPIGLEGEETEGSKRSLELINRLRQSMPDREFLLWDERLSTVTASELLHQAGKNTRKQKKLIDAAAAAISTRTRQHNFRPLFIEPLLEFEVVQVGLQDHGRCCCVDELFLFPGVFAGLV